MGRRLEEIIQFNTSFPRSQKYLFSPRGVIALKISQNKEITGEEKNGGEKGVGSAAHRRKTNRESIKVKETKQGKAI